MLAKLFKLYGKLTIQTAIEYSHCIKWWVVKCSNRAIIYKMLLSNVHTHGA